jgi:PAS domain S-box-containing protein
MKPDKPNAAAVLRRRAEEQLQNRTSAAYAPLSAHETQRLLQELKIHQIELEMQNDELRQSKADLEASQKRFVDLYDFAPVGYCLVSDEGLILEANLTAAILLGVARGDLLKQPIFRFILKEDQEIYHQFRKQLLETREPQACELRLVRHPGTSFWARLETTIAQDETGTTVSRLVLTDISRKQADALERLNNELIMVNRELETFSYSVAHDLSTPLRSIAGFSQVLLDDYADTLDARANGFLDRIVAAVTKMGLLIDDLLSLSRVTRKEMTNEHVNLTDVVRRITRSLAENSPERQVEFRIADGLIVDCDDRLVSIVLQNLIGNAWKFTHKSEYAVIEFGVLTDNDETVYFVRDNGAGFDMAYAGKLFNPFQRLHQAEDFPGTGIGLATVKRIIERHGGRAWIEGVIGKGATVYFTLE